MPLPLPAMAAVTQSVCDTSRAESSAFMSLKVSRADSVVEGRSTKQDATGAGSRCTRGHVCAVRGFEASRHLHESTAATVDSQGQAMGRGVLWQSVFA